jgi:hypothetical protein
MEFLSAVFGLNANLRFAILCKHFEQKAQRCFSKYATVEYVTVRSINIVYIIIQNRVADFNIRIVTRVANNV